MNCTRPGCKRRAFKAFTSEVALCRKCEASMQSIRALDLHRRQIDPITYRGSVYEIERWAHAR